LDSKPVSCFQLGEYFKVDGKQLQQQYKDHISDYKDWDQKDHADKWLIFPDNIGTHISIDETSVSNGELYTIITNKAAKGRKGCLIAVIEGTASQQVIEVIERIPQEKLDLVEEVTLDLSDSMRKIVRRCFPKAIRVIDRFHVQKLAYDALQEMRIEHRWDAINEETDAKEEAKLSQTNYQPAVFRNGDSTKQLLARSRYLLFKSPEKWTQSQKLRAEILFEQYPDIKQAYSLTHSLRMIYAKNTVKDAARLSLAHWYNKVSDSEFKSFNTIAGTIHEHYDEILNFFINRSTNASAESFNAKIKAFRASLRGVVDIRFFLYRLTKIYA